MLDTENRELLEEYLHVLAEQHRRLVKKSFRAWCVSALADEEYLPAAHHDVMIRELESLAAGEIDRLMIFMPPGHAKTLYAAILFPIWFMAQSKPNKFGHYKTRAVIGASHGSEYAENDISWNIIKRIQKHKDLLGFRLLNDSRKLWRTSNGCLYRAAGVDGSITGRRAHLFIVDDPIKGRKDADSEVIRNATHAWWRAEVITRLVSGAKIVLIQTRWHEDDLAGRLLQDMASGGKQWRVISMPAIAEDQYDKDGQFIPDPLGRLPGQALWPEEYPLHILNDKRREVGEREWSALYQQRPRPIEGSLFKTVAIHTYDVAPHCVSMVRAWDLAATENMNGRDPDYTVGLKLGRLQDGRFVVLNIVRFRGDPAEVLSAVINTAKQDGKFCRIRIPQDPGAGGKSTAFFYVQKLAGYSVSVEREDTNKANRATPVAAQINIGNVGIVQSAWNRDFLEELASFPASTHDDQVDALAGAFTNLTQTTAPPMRIASDVLQKFR